MKSTNTGTPSEKNVRGSGGGLSVGEHPRCMFGQGLPDVQVIMCNAANVEEFNGDLVEPTPGDRFINLDGDEVGPVHKRASMNVEGSRDVGLKQPPELRETGVFPRVRHTSCQCTNLTVSSLLGGDLDEGLGFGQHLHPPPVPITNLRPGQRRCQSV